MNNENFDRTVVLNSEEAMAQYEASLKSGKVKKYQDIGPGAVLGNWRILKQLAAGGMGEIFICHPVDDVQSRAVMKILRADTYVCICYALCADVRLPIYEA